MRRSKRRVRMLMLTAGIVCAGVALLWRPAAVAGGISRGLSICSAVLIPSLFPFLVLGGFLTRSGVAAAIGRRLEGMTRLLFGLPGCCAAGILIGAVGGYPAGGTVVGELVRSGQIDRAEGRRMLRFCVNGGPGFVISAVGAGLMGSIGFGVILFAAHLLASLLLGILGASPGSRQRRASPPRRAVATLPPSAALVGAVTAACEALLYMCGFVLLFSAVLALVDVSGAAALLGGSPPSERLWSAIIACLLEVSCGCTAAAALSSNAVLLLGFAVGFGGLSVHCQLAATLQGLGLMDRRFFVARLAQGVLTAFITLVLLRYIPLPQAVWGTGQQPVAQAFSGSVAMSAALLVLGGVWMLTVGHLDKPVAKPYNERKKGGRSAG